MSQQILVLGLTAGLQEKGEREDRQTDPGLRVIEILAYRAQSLDVLRSATPSQRNDIEQERNRIIRNMLPRLLPFKNSKSLAERSDGIIQSAFIESDGSIEII